jgi:hypothetical protein
MATVRLVIVLLILGTVLLLAVQNTTPALPLVFLGGQTGTLPLAVWLLLAIALGALTTLFFTALLGSGGGGSRSKAYKYRPQPFYEPADTRAAARDAVEDLSDSGPTSHRSTPRPSPQRPARADGAAAATDGSWQAWTNLQSANPSSDWEAVAAPPRRQGTQASAGGGVGNWFFGNRKAAEQDQVNQSWRELSDDWDGMENRDYRARGVSPVDESLEDINQGWDQAQGANPAHGFEVPQSPQRVYQDGSLYSYSYRDQDSAGQQDNIYAPADDVVYGDQGFDRQAYVDLSEPEGYPEDPDPGPADYGAGGHEGEDLEAPAVAEDGVVDADYRVIIPPSPTAEANSPEPEPTAGDADWSGDGDGNDDWDEAEDALTP